MCYCTLQQPNQRSKRPTIHEQSHEDVLESKSTPCCEIQEVFHEYSESTYHSSIRPHSTNIHIYQCVMVVHCHESASRLKSSFQFPFHDPPENHTTCFLFSPLYSSLDYCLSCLFSQAPSFHSIYLQRLSLIELF